MPRITYKIYGKEAINAFLREFEIKAQNKAKSLKTFDTYKHTLLALGDWQNAKDFEKQVIIALNDLSVCENTKFLKKSIFKVFAKWYLEATGIHMSLLNVPKIVREHSNRRAYTPQEQETIFEELEAFNNPRFKWIFKFLFINGIRISEFDNVDWEAFKQRKINGEFWVQRIKTAKSHVERQIYIPSSDCESELFKTMQEDFLELKLNISSKTVKNLFGEFSSFVKTRREEFKDVVISAHILRHCFITNLMRKGYDIYHVAKIVGHASPQMINMTYWDLDEEEYSKAMYKSLMSNIDAKELTNAEIIIKNQNDLIVDLKSNNLELANELERVKAENASLKANKPFYAPLVNEDKLLYIEAKLSRISLNLNNNLKIMKNKAYNKRNDDKTTNI